MQLFYSQEIQNGNNYLPEEEAQHALRVLRKSVGDRLDIVDGKGNLYHTKIIETTKRECVFEIENTENNFGGHNYNLHIAVAPTKNNDRIEWFLEKATEIGIDNVWFLNCEHSERTNIKIERFEKVVVSAMKQSLKAYKPILNEMQNFEQFISMDFGTDELYIAHCNEDEQKIHLKDIAKPQNGKKVVIIIGPEGDFSEKEILLAKEKGFRAISLGESRLRTETACLYSTAIISLL